MSIHIFRFAIAGGILAWLVFNHLCVDFFLQSNFEAMHKHNNIKIRARHCLIYALGFVPLLWYLGFTGWEWAVGLGILFGSHLILDTYYVVYLWAKYIRRPPEMTEPRKEIYMREGGLKATRVLPPNAKAGFVEWVGTPLGKILLISIDQLTHILFLLPLAWMVM